MVSDNPLHKQFSGQRPARPTNDRL
ncbi:AbrB/MazE/SpoVT family DNA-binding domain-containing protein, partial [Xanthomonas citri pv. citri]|nr:AbrB/MazE/SpoVT family DNA-binding domain-containing protein [Xanthomonas citri pv. citri]MBD3964073.1 AbrB/MazE/SpoVT family DNA-binding domain-containing protein [Xanthomonas citri pv. citri]MBD3966604.1 AbrB/MazE/SpoVT family DNA-binding domain-containing protein [Xanthomonas citri pv. citri]MBD3969942.1 AbrB/MazE/SpoVT family DNA-binding domain-containing protein [Xanthomonas citri pv. citri]MBD3974111.1 AbrB/MazE/SpoVT family DNA-binding domain-containing protein [Xanthomonas citri pv. 